MEIRHAAAFACCEEFDRFVRATNLGGMRLDQAAIGHMAQVSAVTGSSVR